MNKIIFLILIGLSFMSCNSQSKSKMKQHQYKYTNELIHETSPYLLQHAHNPVNWMPWGDKAIEKAKKENKLIIISIGYAACHWCHVMEHESFESEEVAKLMNDYFISIKVDREERPDIDQVYMNAVQLMTGRGGWPLNCVALPDGRPFWGGTYFRKENWMSALKQLAELYKKDPKKIESYANNLTEGIKQSSVVTFNSDKEAFSLSKINNTVNKWQNHLDFKQGGSKGAPKFPMPNNLSFLLQYAVQSNNKELLNYVNTTLTKMAFGGIFDQIEGGFSRYSTDQKWHIPHFEKMLYDNAQLVSVYSNAYQLTKNKLYKSVVQNTLNFVEQELTDQSGAFYSSLDADSLDKNNHLEEGAYYSFSKTELEKILGADFNLFAEYYNVNNYGHWEKDSYVLIRTADNQLFAKKNNLSVNQLEKKVSSWQNILLKYKERRNKPRLDDKSLTSWNALMLKGYLDAYATFNNPHYLKVALKNAQFILTKQLLPKGNLLHSYKNGKSTINGYLEDYASVIDAFIQLYEVTLQDKWIQTAKQLTDYTFDHFFDENNHMFYFTSNLDKKLISRKFEIEDNVIPASNSIMANNLFKLSHYYSNNYYLKVSNQMLHNIYPKLEDYGGGYSNWLKLLSNRVGSFYEIAVSGKDALSKINEINQTYFPNKLIAGTENSSKIPLMEGRDASTETLIYVCVDGACKLPITDTRKIWDLVKIAY
ncbi:MAG: thioredoxin domain-containing protein [Lutibacter sp.]